MLLRHFIIDLSIFQYIGKDTGVLNRVYAIQNEHYS